MKELSSDGATAAHEGSRAAGSAPPRVLVIGGAASRGVLAREVGRACAVQELAPEQLHQRGRLVDAVAAVAILEPDNAESSIPPLEGLRELPAGARLVLVTRDLTEPSLAHALDRLRPCAWLPHGVPAAALRFVLDSLALHGLLRNGARTQQRPATQLLGVSQALREVLAQVARVAPTLMPVLILGETGTGKELVARAIHNQSDRRDAPFVAVNCGALPDALLEAELFGHAQGAFTGANRSRNGLFQEAGDGTLFLDEIGDTSTTLQVKLLRALEAKEIRRLGETRVHRVDVRVVCATHRDLEGMVREERFRQDLLYRINAATIYLPPLRRRRVDIPFLAQHFAEEFGEAQARRIALEDSFLEALCEAELPGNVRELRNLVERAIALARPGEALEARHLASLAASSTHAQPRPGGTASSDDLGAPTVTLNEEVEALERRLIRAALARCDGNRTRVAEALGLSRQGLRNRLRRYGLDR